jgi:DNA-binding transcriptional ArsR family regulator
VVLRRHVGDRDGARLPLQRRPAGAGERGPGRRAAGTGVIAACPGLGTRELARRTGLAPASVSEHARVLRRAGLTAAAPDGSRVVDQLTPLGWALLLRG